MRVAQQNAAAIRHAFCRIAKNRGLGFRMLGFWGVQGVGGGGGGTTTRAGRWDWRPHDIRHGNVRAFSLSRTAT